MYVSLKSIAVLILSCQLKPGGVIIVATVLWDSNELYPRIYTVLALILRNNMLAINFRLKSQLNFTLSDISRSHFVICIFCSFFF